MAVLLRNNVTATLATALSATDTGIALTSGHGARFPSLGAGEYFYATLSGPTTGPEIVKVTTRVGDALTVVRAQEGTVGQHFPSGGRVEMRVTAASITDLVDEHDQASEITIADAGGYYTSTNVEGALQEAAVYNQGGTGATTRTVRSRLQDYVSVKDFGAVGDGVTDDTAAIQAAFSSATQRIFIPNGTYKITASLTLDGNKSVEGAGSNVGMSTIRLENSAVLEVIKVGSTSIFGGSIKNIVTDRVTYSGATENIGWAFYDMAGCVIEGISSRLSKYNFYFKPSTGKRVAYNTFINISGVGGFYNMAGALSGTGFVNENVFLGGRMFTTADTNTNVYFDFSNNHNRWVAMSCEGSGSQAFYIEGTALLNSHSNVVWNCRTEGTWSVDDVVLGTNTQRNTVDCRSLYTTVTDNGSNNSIFTSTLNKFSTGDNNSKTMVVQRIGASTSSSPALTVSDQYAASGDSFGILVESGRDTATGYIIQGKRKSDGLDRFHVTSQGSLYASINLEAGQSAWNFSPLKLGNYVLWVDSTGDLRIKNGAPASDTDGTVVGTQT